MSHLPKLGNIYPLIPAGDDVENAIAFYEQKLGFTMSHKEGNPARMAIVERDSAVIFLVKNNDQHLAAGTSIRIQVDGIEQLYTELQAKEAHIIQPDGKLETKPWGPKEFVVRDLAGVWITFFELPKQWKESLTSKFKGKTQLQRHSARFDFLVTVGDRGKRQKPFPT